MKRLSTLVQEGATRVRVVKSAGRTIFPVGAEFDIVAGQIHPTNSNSWGEGTVNGEPNTLFEDASLSEKPEEPNTLFGIRADKFSNEELAYLAKSVAEEMAKRLL